MHRKTLEKHYLLGALTLHGFIAPFVLTGPINCNGFKPYVEKVLVPKLRAGESSP